MNEIKNMTNDIFELKTIIEKYSEDDEYKSYEVSPLLKRFIELNETNLQEYNNAEDKNEQFLYDVCENFVFIGDTYRSMGRFSLSAKYFEKALDASLILYCDHDVTLKDVDTLLYDVLKDRNYYVDDDCHDVLDKVKVTMMIDPNTVEKIEESVMTRRRSFKHDPVEMSEEYLAVIDEVEEKVAKNRTLYGMGSCHEVWALKEEYLLEKGIRWKSPAMLNPRVMFD